MPKPSSTHVNIELLDDEGGISRELEACLQHVFAKYCTPRPSGAQAVNGGTELLVPPPHAYLSAEGLDTWARDTNGAPFTQETKDELVEFLDVTEEGGLTFKGFLQIYQLQTENDEKETWKDLRRHGFDRNLKLVLDPVCDS